MWTGVSWRLVEQFAMSKAGKASPQSPRRSERLAQQTTELSSRSPIKAQKASKSKPRTTITPGHTPAKPRKISPKTAPKSTTPPSTTPVKPKTPGNINDLSQMSRPQLQM